MSIATASENTPNNDAIDVAMADTAPLEDSSDDSHLYVDATAFSEDDEGNINIVNAAI